MLEMGPLGIIGNVILQSIVYVIYFIYCDNILFVIYKGNQRVCYSCSEHLDMWIPDTYLILYQ